MKTTLRILLVAGLVALPYGGAQADPQVRGLIEITDEPRYDHYDVAIWTNANAYWIGESVEITVTVGRPGFVTVYDIDALGRVQRLTRDPRGEWVTPGRPLYLPRHGSTLLAAGPGGEEVLVAVVRPDRFRECELPYLGSARAGHVAVCGTDRNGFIARTNAALLDRRLRPEGNVARTTFWVEARHRRPPVQVGGGVWIDFGIYIPLGARVYVDGLFCGLGPSVLERLSPGKHKITVVTREGRKKSHEVQVPRRDARRRADVDRNPEKAVRDGSKKR